MHLWQFSHSSNSGPNASHQQNSLSSLSTAGKGAWPGVLAVILGLRNACIYPLWDLPAFCLLLSAL